MVGRDVSRVGWGSATRVAVLGGALSLGACGALTREEAATALEELEASADATALTGSSVEIATSFTIGQAVEDAAQEIRSFVESQLPCAEVTVSGATLTIAYGARPGTCTFRGQTYAGTHAITVMRNEMDDVVVSHAWTDFRNQTVEVDGSAMVTWSFDDQTRHVSHTLTWVRASDGRTGTGTGDRTQGVLSGGLLEGFTESGERTWTGEEGRWALSIEGVEMRWIDPVPQAGRYVLDTPFAKQLTASFARTGPRTIHVTITSGPRVYEFDVTSVAG
jgi:hypothetical protein